MEWTGENHLLLIVAKRDGDQFQEGEDGFTTAVHSG